MYLTDVVTLPRFCIGRGVAARFASLCTGLGERFVVVGGETAMAKGLPIVREAAARGALTLAGALPFGGACTQAAMARLAREAAALEPAFLVGMGGGKAVDTTKGVAHLLGVPMVSMPTLISNCAPVTALSVVYSDAGTFERFQFYDAPPAMTIVDLDIAATAPAAYFRAGLGDTLAKHLESTFSARGDVLGETMDHLSLIGVSLSDTCYDPILRFGCEGLAQAQAHAPGKAFELCARSVIVSAGLVSLLADDQYNCALAHAVCYGLQRFAHVERTCLHGDLVAYGALVQLMLDGQADRARALRAFLVALGTPVTLRELHVPLDRQALADTLVEATTGPDMAHIPYPVTEDMVFDAMCRVEALDHK